MCSDSISFLHNKYISTRVAFLVETMCMLLHPIHVVELNCLLFSSCYSPSAGGNTDENTDLSDSDKN